MQLAGCALAAPRSSLRFVKVESLFSVSVWLRRTHGARFPPSGVRAQRHSLIHTLASGARGAVRSSGHEPLPQSRFGSIVSISSVPVCPPSDYVFKPTAEDGLRISRTALGGGGLTRRWAAFELEQ